MNVSPTEIEVKILEIDLSMLNIALDTAKAKQIYVGMLTDRTFDFPDMRLTNAHQLLRLRLSDADMELCYKGPAEHSATVKKREERVIPLGASSLDDVTALLHAIGLEQIGYQEKQRTSYMVGDVRIDIDQYPDIPMYAEIEGPNEDAINETIALLGLTENERTTRTSRELYYRYKPDGDFSNVRFDN